MQTSLSWVSAGGPSDGTSTMLTPPELAESVVCCFGLVFSSASSSRTEPSSCFLVFWLFQSFRSFCSVLGKTLLSKCFCLILGTLRNTMSRGHNVHNNCAELTLECQRSCLALAVQEPGRSSRTSWARTSEFLLPALPSAFHVSLHTWGLRILCSHASFSGMSSVCPLSI